MLERMRALAGNRDGAVAPTVALSLFILVACAGLAFDYAHMAAMETELQQAADQAALAAASQLDKADGAQDRATAAISAPNNADRLAANFTRFANDAAGATVELTAITFCSEFDDSVKDTADACTEADGDADSRVVVVTTETRAANYAFTPIVAALTSGPMTATAVAGIDSSICNVAPLLVCAPKNPDGTTDNSFPDGDDIGKGIRLKPPVGPDSWAPGNWGLLDFGSGNNGVINALLGFGLNGCQATDDNETEPGVKEVTDALNTRLDVYDTSNNKVWWKNFDHDGDPKTPKVTGPACNTTTGNGCPAPNTRKDAYLTMVYETTTAPTVTVQPPMAACGATGTGITYANDFLQDNGVKGFPRDNCHNTNNCTGGNIGNGTWDFAGYMAANHPGVDTTLVGGTTRYATYLWEIVNRATAMGPQQIGGITESTKVTGGKKTWTLSKKCAFTKPKVASAAFDANGVPLYATQKDRRVLPIVAANCDNLKGKGGASSSSKGYVLLRVFDVFVTEPSFDRFDAVNKKITDNKEIYAEIIGPAETGEGTSGFQYYAKVRPYLIR